MIIIEIKNEAKRKYQNVSGRWDSDPARKAKGMFVFCCCFLLLFFFFLFFLFFRVLLALHWAIRSDTN